MSQDVLFVGGPWDGERRAVKELRPWFDVPFLPGGQRLPLHTPAEKWPQPVFRVVEYVLQEIRVGSERVHFYVLGGIEPPEAVRMLVAGYRQPKLREER